MSKSSLISSIALLNLPKPITYKKNFKLKLFEVQSILRKDLKPEVDASSFLSSCSLSTGSDPPGIRNLPNVIFGLCIVFLEIYDKNQ